MCYSLNNICQKKKYHYPFASNFYYSYTIFNPFLKGKTNKFTICTKNTLFKVYKEITMIVILFLVN